MYDVLPSFVLGFHGCDATVARRVIAGHLALKPSENDYDWLGHGIYFWENNPQRAQDYAREVLKRSRQSKGGVRSPAVVGAVIDLGRCLNLLDAAALQIVKDGYESLAAAARQAGEVLPENRRGAGSSDLLFRHLDCAVIETVHRSRQENERPAFDSVRGVFVEGKPLYPNAGFHDRNPIQICVRNLRCIKGYFRVLPDPAGAPTGTRS